jgi:rare lipoprotein A
MNTKLLIPALVMLLASCATTPPDSPRITGSGAGFPGAGNNSGNKTTTSGLYSPPLPKPSANATNTADPALMKGTGAGSGQNLDNKPGSGLYSPSTSKPPIQTESHFSSEKKNANSFVIVKPRFAPDENKAVPEKNDALNDRESWQKTEPVIKPPLNRYTDNKHKNSSFQAPASSAGNPSRYVIAGENYKVLPFSNGFVERGIASWYGPDFHGEKTSNGEIYDMYGMTAAHKRLPIPSYVRVTNLKNKRSVVLRINDRGPFYADRVIDLSYTAAQKLDIHQPGTEMVQIEAIKTSHKESVYLQLGVFSNPANAQMLQKKVVENNMPLPMVKQVQVAGKLAYRVQLGPIFSIAKVHEFNAKLAKMGISETWYVTENKIN